MTKVMKTSWSNKDLKSLSKLSNHRYIYDGYEYVWEHKLSGTWSKHCIKLFKDVKKLKEYMAFNLSQWSLELAKRNKGESELEARLESARVNMIDREFKAIIKISKKKYKPIKKVQLILEVREDLDNATIAKALGLSERTFYRYIKKINLK
tara:strand:- start:100 stop:552 length:453 start_codon:yes stop_codon:yes gene_type:complete